MPSGGNGGDEETRIGAITFNFTFSRFATLELLFELFEVKKIFLEGTFQDKIKGLGFITILNIFSGFFESEVNISQGVLIPSCQPFFEIHELLVESKRRRAFQISFPNRINYVLVIWEQPTLIGSDFG